MSLRENDVDIVCAQDSLRRRFGNALHWFTSLKNATTAHVDVYLGDVRTITSRQMNLQAPPSPRGPAATVEPDDNRNPRDRTPPQANHVPQRRRATVETVDDEDDQPRIRRRYRATVESDDDAEQPHSPPRTRRRRAAPEPETVEEPFPLPPPMDRPSDYLRARCPLCFGGHFPPPRTTKSGYVLER